MTEAHAYVVKRHCAACLKVYNATYYTTHYAVIREQQKAYGAVNEFTPARIQKRVRQDASRRGQK